MKLKLGILDTCINSYIKFQNVASSFNSTNKFINLIVLLESQFSSVLVSNSKIHIKLKIKSNLIKQNLINKPYMSSVQKYKVLKKNHSKKYMFAFEILILSRICPVCLIHQGCVWYTYCIMLYCIILILVYCIMLYCISTVL